MNNEKVLARIIAIRALFVDDAAKFYRWATLWVLTIIGFAPELYNNLVANNYLDKVPPMFTTVLHYLAILGVMVRFIKQRKVTSK